MNLREAYVLMQDNCGIQDGDTVKVLRSAKNLEMGWHNSWTGEMQKTIGEELKVIGLSGKFGIDLENNQAYPFFVLKKIAEAKKTVTIQVVGGKTVELSIESVKALNLI